MLVLSVLAAFIDCGISSVVPFILILAREFLITGVRLSAAAKGEVIAANIWGKVKTVVQGILMSAAFVYMYIYSFAVPGAGFDDFSLVVGILVWIIAAVTVFSLIPYLKENGKYLRG